MTPTERTGVHVELYARERLPSPVAGRRERIEARLAELSAEEGIASFDVRTWPKRIPCDGGADPEVRDRYLAFESWATREDARLTPFFGTRECYSMATGERGDWIVLPALCLAVYEDGSLEAVYPHTEGNTYRSVLSGIQSLADPDSESDSDSESVDPARPPVAD
jgi:hypothetical protein